MKRRLFFIGVVILSLAASVVAQANSFTGRVLKVSDGDTISVRNGDELVTVRLHGIDCPEATQPFGEEATAFASRLVNAKQVTVIKTDTDRYGRTVGIVLIGNRVVNHELVAAGLAWHYTRFAPDDQALASLQESAKAKRLGLWSQDNPIAPWDHRGGGGEVVDNPVSRSAPSLAPAPAPYVAPAPAPYIAPAPVPAPMPRAVNENQSATVYITRTGTKYHSAGCRYLKQSASPIPLDRARGSYGPCSVCSPPR